MLWTRFVVAIALLSISCSSGSSARDGSGAGGGAGAGSLVTTGFGGIIGMGGGAGTGIINPGDSGTLPPLDGKIMPAGSTVTVSGQPLDVPFHFTLSDGSQPTVVWIVDDTRIGSIDANGVFHANGYVGGVVTVTATTANGQATTQLTVTVDITDNTINLPPADQGALVAGGNADATFRWLYPYDQTVFPRGLPAPTMQFGGTPSDVTYLKITAPNFSYQQFATGSTPTRVTLRDAVWRGLGLTAGPKDVANIAVTKRSGAQVSGPVKEGWIFAQASLKGIVYYGTYKSPLAPNGGVMSLRPGQTAQVVQAGCTVCHSVSASGNVLSAALNYLAGPPAASDDNDNPIDSATYNLTAAGTLALRTQSTEGRLFSFSALTPDGAIALINGIPPNRWPPFISRGVFSMSGFASRLVNTATGATIAAPSLTQMVTYAETPAFSPDGKHVAFANGDRLEKRVLSEMDFDGSTMPPTFSNPRDLISQDMPAVAWPSFLPDASGIIYHEGDSFDSYQFPPTSPNDPSLPQYAEIRLVETADKTVKTLEALNGHLPGGATYLPYGAVVEGRMNYEPNVIPVAVGGYYWVLFTSRRTYGNTISPDSTVVLGADPWGRDAAPSPRKKLWLAAIDVDHPTKTDPSHPALYLPGQEVESGNMRAFAALAPCKPQGADCESGADCCAGFCRETSRSADGGVTLQCVPPPVNQCSNVDETCKSAADCCNRGYLCINNRCALPPPPR
jgi:hypothetical protein